MATESTPPDGHKWATLRKIDASSWNQIGVGSQGHFIWELQEDWLRVMFKGAYSSVRACAGAGMQPLQAVCFIAPDDVRETRLFSRLMPGGYYDSSWYFGEARPPRENIGHFAQRRVQTNLSDGNTVSGSANVIWTVDPDRDQADISAEDCNIRLFCSAIDETIDLNLETLDLRYEENAQEQEMRVIPWQRLLVWYLRLRDMDKSAYKRIKPPVRRWIEQPDAEQRIAELTEREIGMMQQEGLLPPYIAWLTPDEAPQVLQSIGLQQSIANRPDVISQFANLLQIPNYNPIPQVLLQIDPNGLDIIDIQILMTIGAVRELHGFVEVETQRLLERRPDLKMAMQSPQGARQLQADPEIAALNANPWAMAEQQNQQELAMRQAGNFGPTPRDITIATQVMIHGQQTQMAGMMMGGGLGMSLGLLAGMTAGDQYIAAALADAPPWKLYKPYIC